MQLLLPVGRWISHHALILLGIVIALLVTNHLREGLPLANRYMSANASLPSTLDEIRGRHKTAAAQLEQLRKQLAALSPSSLQRQLSDAEVAAEQARDSELKRCEALELLMQGVDRCLRAKLDHQLATTKVELLRAGLANRNAMQQLEDLRQKHALAYAALINAQESLAAIELAHPVEIWVPGTKARRDWQSQRSQVSTSTAKNLAAHQAYQQLASKIGQSKAATNATLPPFTELEVFAGRKLNEAKSHVGEWLIWVYQQTSSVVALALLMLLALIATPIATRAILFGIVAPRVSRLHPTVARRTVERSTDAGADAMPIGAPLPSIANSVRSLSLELQRDEELLVRWPYLRGHPDDAVIRTKLFLDSDHVRTSIASGLWLVTHVRLPRTGVVVMNSDDTHVEMACLTVPAGAAVVINPHALCAIVQRQDARMPVSRQWQLSSALAWLTLRLRVVVARGPVKLVVAGYGGVRIEPVVGSRSVHASCTLAYSTSVARSVRRREPMLPYLIGRQGLFDDQFSCDSTGVVLIAGHSRHGESGRQMESALGRIVDSVLRAFGI